MKLILYKDTKIGIINPKEIPSKKTYIIYKGNPRKQKSKAHSKTKKNRWKKIFFKVNTLFWNRPAKEATISCRKERSCLK